MSALFFVITAATFTSLGVVLPAMVTELNWSWTEAGTGFGLLALTDLMAQAESVAPPSVLAPLAARWPHHMARAKRVIFLYMPGGPSHVDLFDPKPRLATDNGKPLPFAKPKLERTKTGNLLASPWKFSKHGQSGTAVSELLP